MKNFCILPSFFLITVTSHLAFNFNVGMLLLLLLFVVVYFPQSCQTTRERLLGDKYLAFSFLSSHDVSCCSLFFFFLFFFFLIHSLLFALIVCISPLSMDRVEKGRRKIMRIGENAKKRGNAHEFFNT
jgi:hypothetical protein